MSNVTHIGVFGKRNSGKSSLINILAGQEVAIVSPTPGTTTDPVKKRMEVPEIGPVLFIDTAGIDDSGTLGEQRIEKTKSVIPQIDLALLLFTANQFDNYEIELIQEFIDNDVPFIIIHNQSDIISLDKAVAKELSYRYKKEIVEFSCSIIDEREQKSAVDSLISVIVKDVLSLKPQPKKLFDGLASSGDIVVLVCPVDSQTPEGRLILPQVNAIRDLIDKEAIAVVLQPQALPGFIERCGSSIKLVATDSQVFDRVSPMVPESIPLTGFSMLLARIKGSFSEYLKGTPYIDKLEENDKVLILESCSHHASCDDIGRVKIPALLSKKSGKKILWDIVAGLDPLPKDMSQYKLVIQCGGCMITNRQLASRINYAIKEGIPVTNYGMALAWCMGIYQRAAQPFLNLGNND